MSARKLYDCGNCDHAVIYFNGMYYHLDVYGNLQKKCGCGCETPINAKDRGDLGP